MDRLDAMQTVLDVVEAGSLTAAGRKLGMPLATISRKVSELETYLGARLFTRTSRRLELTDAGAAYIAALPRLLAAIAEAERAASGEYNTPRGELVITAPVVFGRMHVQPVALDFLKAHPEIDLRIVLSDAAVDLIADHVDVAVRIGALPDSDLVARRIGQTRRVVCASPDYLTRRGTPRNPDELGAHDGISLDSLAGPRGWRFISKKQEVTIALHNRVRVNDTEAAIDAALAGVGLARVLGYQIAEPCRTGALNIVLEAFEPAPWPIHVVHVAQGPVPQKVRAFLDWATPRLTARLSQSESVTKKSPAS